MYEGAYKRRPQSNVIYSNLPVTNPQSLSRDACRQVDIHRHGTCTDMNVVNPFASTSQSPLTFKNMALWCEQFVFNGITASSLVTEKANTHRQSNRSHQICYAPPEFTNKQNDVALSGLTKSRLEAGLMRRRSTRRRLFFVKPPATDCTSKMRASKRDRCVHDDTSSMRIVFNTRTRRRPDGD